jgi:acyl-CoA thioester hydrolase
VPRPSNGSARPDRADLSGARGTVPPMRLAHDPVTDPGAYPFTHRLRVRFAETDAMGIVHHAAYLPYLEEARVHYLDAIGHPYTSVRAEGIDFAVLEAFVRYLAPLRFDDRVDVAVKVVAATRATFQLAYLLTVDGAVRSTGVTVHGCVDPTGRPVRMPAWLRELAEPAG